MVENRTQKQEAMGTLGTFTGVFTPSVLTILGIILFLRLGFVVGSSGLARALIMVGLANTISVLTSISLSAIATNLKVKRGGDYYMISRTLGGEFGGSIGIVLFMAQAVSIAFYAIGFGEVLSTLLRDTQALSPRLIAAISVSLLFGLAWLGSDWASRFQYLVMILLVMALVSFFVGSFLKWDTALLVKNIPRPADSLPFWYVFAIFFPAVTGFTQGVSMSGDLKDPGKSLPIGTFAAVFVSIAVYVSVALLFAATSSLKTLSTDFTIMKQTAYWGVLIDAGVIAATLSSAMASFMGAPRILQSLASDRIFPFLTPFAKGAGPNENPRRGIVLSGGIALSAIALGNLDLIAPVVSMFFLISYGLLNYATYYEAKGDSPSFRPRFKLFDKRLSLVGCLVCLGVMLAINFAYSLVAISILVAIYYYLRQQKIPSRWADSKRSFYFQEIRKDLLAAEKEPAHPRHWRPQILAFCDDATQRETLLTFASWLQGRSGFITAVRILLGKGPQMASLKKKAQAQLKQEIQDLEIEAFSLVIVTSDGETGMGALVQSHGIGPLKANTLILNWKAPQENAAALGVMAKSHDRHLKIAFKLGCNLIALDSEQLSAQWVLSIPEEKRRIDIWWGNDKTGQLMLLLAYLMTRNRIWEKARIQVNVNCSGAKRSDCETNIKTLVKDARIKADIVFVTDALNDPMVTSGDAAMVFHPFHFSGTSIDERIKSMPPVALVMAREDIDLDAQPEEGRPGEMASALDDLEKAEETAENAQKDASEAAVTATELLDKVEKATESSSDEHRITDLASQAFNAKKTAEKASKRAARKTAIAEDKDRELKNKMEES